MEEEKQYDIRDINLADSGRIKIDWVRANMPVLSAIEKEFAEKKTV